MWRGRSDGDEQPHDADRPRRRASADRRRSLGDWSDEGRFDAPEAGAASGRKIRRIESGPPGRGGDRAARDAGEARDRAQDRRSRRGQGGGARYGSGADDQTTVARGSGRGDELGGFGLSGADAELPPVRQPTGQLPSVSTEGTEGTEGAVIWSADEEPRLGAIPSSLSGPEWPAGPVEESGEPSASTRSPQTSVSGWKSEPMPTVSSSSGVRNGAGLEPAPPSDPSLHRAGDRQRASVSRTGTGVWSDPQTVPADRGGSERSGSGRGAADSWPAGSGLDSPRQPRGQARRSGSPRPAQKPSEPNRILLGVALGLVVLAGAAVAWWLTRDDGTVVDDEAALEADASTDTTAAAAPEASAPPIEEPFLDEPILELSGVADGPLEPGVPYSIDLVGEPPGSTFQVVVGGTPMTDPGQVLPDLEFGPGRHTISVNIDDGVGVSQSTSLEVFVLDEPPAAGYLANLASIDIVNEGWGEAIRRYDEYRAAGHEGLQILPITPGFWNIFVPGLGQDEQAVRTYCEGFGLAVPEECFAKQFDPADYDPSAVSSPAGAMSDDGTTTDDDGAMTDDGGESTTSTTNGG